MSANIEYALISKVIETSDFNSLDKLGVRGDFFQTPEMKAVYDFLRFTYHNPSTAGSVPSGAMVQQYFPAFQPTYAPDTVAMLCERLRLDKIRAEIFNAAQRMMMEAEADPMAALARLKTTSQSLSAVAEQGHDLSMSNAWTELGERYQNVQNAQGVIGIPYPWKVVNDEVQGLQRETFTLIYGRPKSMKTWVALWIAVYAYLVGRRRVLFYTKEMPPIQIAQRVAAAICKLAYRHVKNATLEPGMLQYYMATLQMLKDEEQAAGKHGYNPAFIITTDGSRDGGGVSWLQSKITEVQPDIVFVDGMYLMKDDRSNSRTIDWKNITHISQDLKNTAQIFHIPVVGITQASRKSNQTPIDDMSDIAHADALAQDADVAFRIKRVVKRDEQTGQKETELHCFTPGFREGALDGFVLRANPAVEFEFMRTIVDEGEVEEKEYEKPKKQYVNGGPQTSSFRRDPANYMQADPKIPMRR